MRVASALFALAVLPARLASAQSLAEAHANHQITLYVSATAGNDKWSGRLAQPNRMHTDGPFATFDRARKAVQSAKNGASAVTVLLRDGLYPLPATVAFGPADSGSTKTAITYQNYPNESPVLSGGLRVQGWVKVNGNLWQARLPAGTQYFENLYYNGVRRLRPRLGAGPLGTYYRVAHTVYSPTQIAGSCTVQDPNHNNDYECFDRFDYDPNDPIADTWKNLAPPPQNPCGQPVGSAALRGDVELMIWEQFNTAKLRVSCVDTTSHRVYLTGSTPMPQANASEVGFIEGNRYLVENVQDALTQPGQWFLDRSTTPWTLSYLANRGENPSTDEVIVPQLTQLVTAHDLQYVTFRGLTFEHDNFTVPYQGYASKELQPDITAALSFQNSQHITLDGLVVRHTSGDGIDFLSCLSQRVSPPWCQVFETNAVTANNLIENGAVYDAGALGIRIGVPRTTLDTDANIPNSTTVVNNVVEGYGRVLPASFGIGQGEGHDNLYTHNDVYDGYHCAISLVEEAGDEARPNGKGNADNTISFNHVHNLLQGIMNDGGSIRIESGNQAFTAAGNKILNNKIHDTSDASSLDANGYGGEGIYMDNQTGLVDVENNLVYRVSSNAIFSPQGPSHKNQANVIKNNILAFARKGMVGINAPYQGGPPYVPNQVFVMENNLMVFDRDMSSDQPFDVQDGCTYSDGVGASAGFPYTSFQLFKSNLYWRTDGGFATDGKAFHVQPDPGTSNDKNFPCAHDPSQWLFYTFAQWQTIFGEDAQSVVRDPQFVSPNYPTDNFALKAGSPGVGFVPFDPTMAGRTSPVLKPPAVAATFLTAPFDPRTDF